MHIKTGSRAKVKRIANAISTVTLNYYYFCHCVSCVQDKNNHSKPLTLFWHCVNATVKCAFCDDNQFSFFPTPNIFVYAKNLPRGCQVVFCCSCSLNRLICHFHVCRSEHNIIPNNKREQCGCLVAATVSILLVQTEHL